MEDLEQERKQKRREALEEYQKLFHMKSPLERQSR